MKRAHDATVRPLFLTLMHGRGPDLIERNNIYTYIYIYAPWDDSCLIDLHGSMSLAGH